MARRALALLSIGLAALLMPSPAVAEGQLCTDMATVSWQTDFVKLQVTGVSVEVLGCDDGEFVGIELLMDDGNQIPPEEPLGSEAQDEVAFFDVSGLDVGIEPVVGIRVYLAVHDVPTPVAPIRVEQRFFNHAGNEQIGLRTVTEVLLPLGGSYVVPSSGPGYRDIDCAEVGAATEDPLVNTGVGTFVAQSAGVHLACYQQVPGVPGGPSPGPPGTEGVEVLGVVLERNGAGPEVLGQLLARTGAGLAPLLLIGTVLLGGGGLLLLRRHSRT